MADERLRHWLSRWFGPTRGDLRAEVDIWTGRSRASDAEAREAHLLAQQVWRQLGEERHKVHVMQEELCRLREQVADLRVGVAEDRSGCAKVRFHYRGGAEQWAVQIIEGTRGEPGTLSAYPCRECPRSPVTMRAYWHVGHPGTDRAQQAKEQSKDRHMEAYRDARRAGRTIGQQVDPRVMARLREMTGGRS